jgi:hypothetical protein
MTEPAGRPSLTGDACSGQKTADIPVSITSSQRQCGQSADSATPARLSTQVEGAAM